MVNYNVKCNKDRNTAMPRIGRRYIEEQETMGHNINVDENSIEARIEQIKKIQAARK